MSIRVIGISGVKHQGKDTFALMLKAELERLGCIAIIDSLAGPMKEGLQAALHVDKEYFWDQDLKEKPLPQFSKEATPRLLLQTFGTEYMKSMLGEDVWLKVFMNKLKTYDQEGFEVYVIVTDVRFEEEVRFFQEHEFPIFFINRNFKPVGWWAKYVKRLHRSEWGVYHLKSDNDWVVMNDKTLKHLEAEACDVAELLTAPGLFTTIAS